MLIMQWWVVFPVLSILFSPLNDTVNALRGFRKLSQNISFCFNGFAFVLCLGKVVLEDLFLPGAIADTGIGAVAFIEAIGFRFNVPDSKQFVQPLVHVFADAFFYYICQYVSVEIIVSFSQCGHYIII